MRKIETGNLMDAVHLKRSDHDHSFENNVIIHSCYAYKEFSVICNTVSIWLVAINILYALHGYTYIRKSDFSRETTASLGVFALFLCLFTCAWTLE